MAKWADETLWVNRAVPDDIVMCANDTRRVSFTVSEVWMT
jgi:hypothetical protein